MDADAKLREKAMGLLFSAQRIIEQEQNIAPSVTLILPDGAMLETLLHFEDEAAKNWAYARISDMARRLQAVAAILLYHGRSSSDYEPGTLAPPHEREKEGGTPCLVVAVKGPGQESEWSCVLWYERKGSEVRWLPPQEFDFCIAPLLADWFSQAGRA